MKDINTFNVIDFDSNKNTVVSYNVLPYFIDTWNDKKFNFDRKEVNNKKSLREWITKVSQYRFWARCEYECLITHWPFTSYKMKSEIEKLNSNNDYDNIINIVSREMYKIDFHEQIMMNIDIITNILSEKFNID